MRSRHSRSFAFALALVAPLAATPVRHASAHGAIHVDGAWSRATPPAAQVGVVYLVVVNGGAEPDRLLGASSPVAAKAELHGSTMDGGVMKMRPLGALGVAPGESVRFEPGGNHVMLTGLRHPLEGGRRFPLTLRFERAGDVVVEVPVRPLGASGPPEPPAHAGHAAGGAMPVVGVDRAFDLALAGGRLAGSPDTLKVTEGETVVLRWTSDAAVALRLHGYDVEAEVAPGMPAEMRFRAHATGRFAVEAHGGGHGALLYLEVHPR